MKSLTPMQLETLAAFYYGEVEITHHASPSRRGSIHMWPVYYHGDKIITGRVPSLRKRRLIRTVQRSDCTVVMLTKAGVYEMEKIDA